MGKNKTKRGQQDDVATRSHVKSLHSKHSPTFPLPFPAALKYPKNEFLRDEPPYEESFQQALETSYEGFCVDDPMVMKDFHQRVEAALLAMEGAGFFRVDVTQPFGLGTKCAKTYVTRCLVGEPGTTYNEALQTIGDLNAMLTQRTKKHLSDLDQKRIARGAEPTKGRLGFDVALINRMESTVGLKDEPYLGQGKCSVSWHADSSLENFSCIAVYHLINKEADTEGKWSVGLRVAHNSEGPQASRRGTDIYVETETPPLAVSLPSGATYCMLDDFNHHHQHTVIAEGKVPGRRFSSTHRLLRDSHNVAHIIARCKSACANFHKKGPKVWRSEQLLLTEMESEWLRQFFIQGQAHHDLLWKNNWQEPMEELLKYWSRLEERTKQTIEWLQFGAEGRCGMDDSSSTADGPAPPRAERKLREKRRKAREGIEELLGRGEVNSGEPKKYLYEPIALLLQERAVMRELWLAREHDGVFHDVSRDNRPIPLPVDFLVGGSKNSIERGQSPMPGSSQELQDMAARLLCWGKAYESGSRSDFAG
ncbi:RNA N6-methyladenosine dioxygenase [Fragilaria crotonensis]|nr:RNA N6-methyladenosine dioxygenase [Fragilaria crotonensis]